MSAVLGKLAAVAGIALANNAINAEADLSMRLHDNLNEGFQDPPPAEQTPEAKERAVAVCMTTLAAMGQLYSQEKLRFLAVLQLQSSQGRVEDNSSDAGPTAEGGGARAMETDCLQAEGDSHAQEAAAQKYIEDLIDAQISVPAAFVPALLSLIGNAEPSANDIRDSTQKVVQPLVKVRS